MLLRGDIVFWSLVIFGAIIVLGVVAMLARRWLSTGPETDSGPAFTLQDLREMRQRGELTDAEFETMRAGMLGAYASHRPAGASGASMDHKLQKDWNMDAGAYLPPADADSPHAAQGYGQDQRADSGRDSGNANA